MKTLKLIALAAFAFLFSQCKTTAPTAPTGATPTLREVIYLWAQADTMFFKYADSTNGDAWRSLFLTMNWLSKQPNVESADLTDSTHIEIVMKSGLLTGFFINLIGPDSLSVTRGGGGIVQNSREVILPQKANLADGGNGNFEKSNPISPATAKKSAKTITNTSILLWIPPYEEFYGPLGYRLQPLIEVINKSSLGLGLRILGDNVEASWTALKDFKNYGLVIMDTHGVRGRRSVFLTGDQLDLSNVGQGIGEGGIETEDYIKRYFFDHNGARIGTYDNVLNGNFITDYEVDLRTYVKSWQTPGTGIHKSVSRLFVTADYLNTLPSMPNTIIFGNMCYGGETQTTFTYPGVTSQGLDGKWIVSPGKTVQSYPIAPAFINRNPIAYYCWAYDDGSSEKVFSPNAILAEDSLVTALVINFDSTGGANKLADNTKIWDTHNSSASHPLYLQLFGADNYSYEHCGDTLVDARDGQRYPTVCIGKQSWMAQNLNYNAPGSVTYNNDPANGTIYGRLYDFKTMLQGAAATNAEPSGVQGVCPKGWHVPSDAEFTTLFITLGDFGGGAMKSTSSLWNSPNLGATNSSGFSALPGGSSSDISNANAFAGIGDVAIFGTTWNVVGGLGDWSTYGILAISNTLDGFNAYQKEGHSCRCVKDP